MVFASFQLSNVMGVINRNVTERYWARSLWVGGASSSYGGYRKYSKDPITKELVNDNVGSRAVKY